MDEALDTLLPDLTDTTVDDLEQLDLDAFVAALYEQVTRPRWNLGGSGPPGRAD